MRKKSERPSLMTLPFQTGGLPASASSRQISGAWRRNCSACWNHACRLIRSLPAAVRTLVLPQPTNLCRSVTFVVAFALAGSFATLSPAAQPAPAPGTDQAINGRSADLFLLDRERGLVPVAPPLTTDEWGVQTGSGERFRWEQLVGGRVGEELQAELDDRIANHGTHLRHLLDRLRREEWEAAAVAAETLRARLPDDSHPVAILIRVAEYRLALFRERPESAVLPWLRLSRHPVLAATHEGTSPELSEEWSKLVPVGVRQQGVAPDLPPVWNDRIRAATVAGDLERQLPVAPEGPPRGLGWWVYLITLKSAAGDRDEARRLYEEWLAAGPADETWQKICLAELDLADGRSIGAEQDLAVLLERLDPVAQPVELMTVDYWWTISRYRQQLAGQPMRGLRELLAFVARTREKSPGVARTALLACLALAREQEWPEVEESLRVQLELLQNARSGYNPDRQ